MMYMQNLKKMTQINLFKNRSRLRDLGKKCTISREVWQGEIDGGF